MIYTINDNGKSVVYANNTDPVNFRGLRFSFVFVEGDISEELRSVLETCTNHPDPLEGNDELVEFSVFVGGKSQTYKSWIPARALSANSFRGILDGVKEPFLKRK